MAPTILDILQESEARLASVDSPRLSAEVLVAEVLGCTRLALVIERDREVSPSDAEHIRALVARRESGEPVAYILGSKEFYGLAFTVTPDVLIPRPETEHIIEAVESLYSTSDCFRFADLGTGSGILAVTLACLFPNATGIAVDLSPGALAIARNNGVAHGVDGRIEFVEGDFTIPLLEKNAFDCIVSNPPYVPKQEYAEASREVTCFEPVTALVSGADGLDHIRAMLPLVLEALKPGGHFLMEIGFQQGEAVKNILVDEMSGFKGVSILKDLSGHDRIVMSQKL